MAKKITAPHSYDPGKGRPKEYLAYLNEREMAYLRSINGNNMERGPRGLPSFPPEDAVGSSSKAGSTKSTTSSGAGRESSRGLGQGAGGAAIGRGPSGPSGGLGGGSKSAPGSSPSSPGGLRGAGGNYGSGSGKPGTTSSPGGYKGPSSPMGGQGPSYSNDTKAQQEAQVRDAIKAVKNTPAFRNDASSGGIRTLSVGPIGTPVNVGPRVTPTAPQKQFYERIAPGTSPSTSISSQFPSYKYGSPLTPGMSPEDMARRGAIMNQIEQEIRDLYRQGDYVKTGDPISAGGGVPRGKTRGIDPGFFSKASAATPEEGLSFEDKFRNVMTPDINISAPPNPEERILGVEDYYENKPRYASGTYTSPYDNPAKNTYGDDFLGPQTYTSVQGGLGMAPFNAMPREDRLSTTGPDAKNFSGKGLKASTRDARYYGGSPQEIKTRGIGQVDPSINNEFSGIESSGEIVREGEFNYPTNADGSPITAEDLANMPEDIKKEYFDKVRYSRNYDTPYPLTKAEKEKGYVAGAIGSLFKRGPIGAALKVASVVPGEIGDAAEKLSNVRKTVNAFDRLDPLKQQQMREREGRGRGFIGGSTSTTSPGGGSPDIGSGGKNEPPRIEQAEKEATKPKPKPKEDGRRPAIYYKWDLGVGVPSPTDSDYTLYLKYLQEKAAAKAGMAR